jgi:hypothetical protein
MARRGTAMETAARNTGIMFACPARQYDFRNKWRLTSGRIAG